MSKLQLYFLSGFPNFLESFQKHSIVKKAITNQQLEIHNINLRDFGIGKHQMIDDYQYGPGKGMVLKPEPIWNALQSIKKTIAPEKPFIILLTPQGEKFNQQLAKKLASNKNHLVLIAGHYEGFDERIRKWVDIEISIGDYILTNGEISAMVVADTIIRLRPNVIKLESIVNESFSNNLLDHPVYTKPIKFQNQTVPKILLSGHHAKIEKWRHQKALLKTALKRPDLLKKYKLSAIEKTWLKKLKN